MPDQWSISPIIWWTVAPAEVLWEGIVYHICFSSEMKQILILVFEFYPVIGAISQVHMEANLLTITDLITKTQ